MDQIMFGLVNGSTVRKPLKEGEQEQFEKWMADKNDFLKFDIDGELFYLYKSAISYVHIGKAQEPASQEDKKIG